MSIYLTCPLNSKITASKVPARHVAKIMLGLLHGAMEHSERTPQFTFASSPSASEALARSGAVERASPQFPQTEHRQDLLSHGNAATQCHAVSLTCQAQRPKIWRRPSMLRSRARGSPARKLGKALLLLFLHSADQFRTNFGPIIAHHCAACACKHSVSEP